VKSALGFGETSGRGGERLPARTLMNRRTSMPRKYGKAASKSVERALRREKAGKLRSGKGGRGGKVTSRKQAIAIGLSEARKRGAKAPKKP